MNCSFTEKISSLIDGELAATEAREVERHLLTCGECEQVKADFLSLRSQIAGFEIARQPAIQNRALRKILSREECVPARGMRWAWSTPAVAFAMLLIVGAIAGFVLYQSKRDTGPKQVAEVETPSPVPSATVEAPKPENSPEPTREPEQQAPNKDDKETNSPKRNAPAPGKKPLVREPKPGEQFAAAEVPERVRPADADTLTAIHFEKSETLLRAFRNVRLNTPSTAEEVGYERKRAQQLVYQNMILRREADASGDVHIKSLLDSLEPILLDIANLPNKPNSNAVRTIRERVERKNIIPLLQVNSAALARALD